MSCFLAPLRLQGAFKARVVPVHQLLKPRAPRRCCYGITVQKSWWRQHRTEEVARGPRGCRLARVLTGQRTRRTRPNCYRRRQHAHAPAHCTRAHRHRRGSLRCIVGAQWPVFRDCGLHVLLRRRLPWGCQQRPLHMRSTWCSVQRHQGTELGQQWRLECGCRGNSNRLLHLCGHNV